MIRFFRGTVELKLTGVSLEACLNRWTKAEISFWDLRRDGDFTARCCICERETEQAEAEANRAQMELQVLAYHGLPNLMRKFALRRVLLFGTLIAVGLAMFAQNFVWFLSVSGTESVPDSVILQALAEEGVKFGAWGPDLNSEDLKNRVLNRIPALRWLAVNREGGVVTVLAAERNPEEPVEEHSGVTNVVAVRSGFIREMSVTEGIPAVAPGDSVEAGDLLISGIAEWTTHTQLLHASGVVYADTLRQYDIVSPVSVLQKVYTGKQERSISIIFQRNRRKISGNSSNLGAMCDRIIESSELTLPGGYQLPVIVETQTLLQYELIPVALSRDAAMEQLQAEADRMLEHEMVAGQCVCARTQLATEQDRYVYRGSFNCREVISKTVPAELYREDAENGEIDQRGTH